MFLIIISLGILTGCQNANQQLSIEETDHLFIEKNELPAFATTHKVYVPAYSNLYYLDGGRKSYFTVVLSLRNTSFTDSIYFTKVEYYNSRGNLIKDYLKNPLVLRPMESIEYIVEQSDDTGGAGANFIVDYRANALMKNKPVIEAVMIGSIGNYGYSFKSDGVELE